MVRSRSITGGREEWVEPQVLGYDMRGRPVSSVDRFSVGVNLSQETGEVDTWRSDWS